MGLKALLIGEGDRYAYGPMCCPTVPWKKSTTKLNFYAKGEWSQSFSCSELCSASFVPPQPISSGVCLFFRTKDEELPLLMACLMGLQHAMAMIGGLITPPLVVFKFTVCGFGPQICPDLVQVSLELDIPNCILTNWLDNCLTFLSLCRIHFVFPVRCQCRFDHLWYLHHHQYPQA